MVPRSATDAGGTWCLFPRTPWHDDNSHRHTNHDTPLSDLSRAARYPEPVHACHFCGSPTPSQWAVTVRNRDAPNDRWRREIVPICPRCNRLLNRARPEGRRLKTTGEWWYAGHTVGGDFDSPGANAMQEHAEREPERD